MNVRTGLGVAPMSTVPYLMYIIEGLSLGTASFIVYCVFVVAQLLLVRYPDVKILLQIPVSLLFSVFIDVLDIWLFPFTATGLIDGLVMLVIAVSFTALGVTPIVSARLVPVAPDGMVQTLSQVFHCEFGKAKYFFDGSCVGISLVYGLVRTGAAVGIGIGTVMVAVDPDLTFEPHEVADSAAEKERYQSALSVFCEKTQACLLYTSPSPRDS